MDSITGDSPFLLKIFEGELIMIAHPKFHAFLTVGYISNLLLSYRCHFHLVKYRTMLLTLMLLMANLANAKKREMTETLANGYSSDSARRELSNEYRHDRIKIIFKAFCVLVLWIKVALALEGLKTIPFFLPFMPSTSMLAVYPSKSEALWR